MGQNRTNPGEFVSEMRWMTRRIEVMPSGAERTTWVPASVFLAQVENESKEFDTSNNQRREVFGIVFVTWIASVSVGDKVQYNGLNYSIEKIESIEKRLYGRYSCKSDGYVDSQS